MSGNTDINMADVYVACRVPTRAWDDRRIEAPIGGECMTLHRVECLQTLESIDRQRVLCHFRAPDAESVRLVLRRLKIDVTRLWVKSRRNRAGVAHWRFAAYVGKVKKNKKERTEP